jgi:hypothetical protein
MKSPVFHCNEIWESYYKLFKLDAQIHLDAPNQEKKTETNQRLQPLRPLWSARANVTRCKTINNIL